MAPEMLKFVEQDLAMALFLLSFGKLTSEEASKKAHEIAPKIDFSDPGISHKGINWCAKQILKTM